MSLCKKNLFNKLLLLFLLVVAISLPIAVNEKNADTSFAADQRVDSAYSRKTSVLSLYVDAMNGAFDSNTAISSIKSLSDFSGHRYTLVECSPRGYLIYSDDAGELVEYSGLSVLPYSAYNRNLFYCGPME